LTDKNVLGTDGFSQKEPRKKSRAILINAEGKYAIIYEKQSGFHTFPGGGIENGENEETAIIREVLEETGCSCDIVNPLGIVYENRFHSDSAHLTYYFVIHTKTQDPVPQYTNEEMELKTMIKWCSLDEAIHLIRDARYNSNHKRFLKARDLAALNQYIDTIK